MNQTTETIVKLIRSTLFDQPLPEEWDPGIDWLDVYTETKKQAIVSLFADFVPELPMPEDVRRRWLKQIYAESLKYYAIIGAHRELDEAFASADIPYVTLKGIAAAQYYPNPMYRDFGDIDLLISPDNIGIAVNALEEKGYSIENEKDDYHRHVNLRKKRISLELHR